MTGRRIIEVAPARTERTGLLHPAYWATEIEPVHGSVGLYDPTYSSPQEELIASVSDLVTRDARRCSCAVEHLFMICSCFRRPQQHAAPGSTAAHQPYGYTAASLNGSDAVAPCGGVGSNEGRTQADTTEL